MGRKKLNITLNNIGFPNGTKERVLLLYPSLTFSAAIRKIVEAHLNEVERPSTGERSFSATVDDILRDMPEMTPPSTEDKS